MKHLATNKMSNWIFLFLCLLRAGHHIYGQGCLRALKRNSDPNDPPFDDDNNRPLPANSAVQAIITTFKFYCDCVNITSWETFLQPGGRRHYMARGYDITFQIWRPSPTVQNDGCYSLVGENVFTSFTFSEGGLVQLTPTPPSNSIITAQSGDVVGYYTNSRTGNNQGIQLERDRDYTPNVIWYHNLGTDSLDLGNNECQVQVGAGRSLQSSTGAAPALKVSTTEVRCPSLPPIPSTSAITSNIVFSPLPAASSPLRTNAATSPLATYAMSSSLTTDTASSVILVSSTNAPSTSLSKVAQVSNGFSELFISDLVSYTTTSRMEPSQANSDIFMSPTPDHIIFSTPSVTPTHVAISSATQLALSSITSPQYVLNSRNGVNTNNYLPFISVSAALAVIIMISVMTGFTILIIFLRNKKSKKDEEDKAIFELSNPNYQIQGENEIKNSSIKNGITKAASQNEELTYHEIESTGRTVLNNNGSQQVYAIYDTINDHNCPSDGANNSVVPTLAELYDDIETSRVVNNSYANSKTSTDRTNPIEDTEFFDTEDTYWTPATTATALYSQLASKKYREVPRRQLKLHTLLGSGQFGEVYKATWSVDQSQMEVAVKTLKSRSSDEDRVKFLQEAAIMGQFRHTNVIKMYGVVTMGEPIYICLELLENGDLKAYLKKLNLRGSKYSDFKRIHQLFLKFAEEIAEGMAYLSNKSFVHRDLAARNVLLDQSLVCKVSDFGMARDLMDDTYYTSSGGKIPVKWTAPEALLYKKYSTDSDVWSYGMVLFEIWSVGRKPYSTLSNAQVIQKIQEGFCQAPPPGCPRAIYELMVDCWNPDHQSRPSFKAISQYYLKQPSAKLLHWGLNDTVNASIGVCGAPLEVASQLHLDLQKMYTES